MIIVTVWPRIAYYGGEILKGVTICWCQIGDEDAQSQELGEVRNSIEQTVQLFTLAVTGKVNVAEEYQALIDSDSRLQGLLVV